ncbi:isochorismatase family protein [Furfurilactobacillus sp. WILCCON 0119]|uniref:isochorismatase family protein n=1 Tax=Furfurilactobacillus entadae TaxID=2922307 RepID=UPI0035EA7176
MADALIIIDMQAGLQDIAHRTQTVAVINQRINLYRADHKPIVFIQHTEPGMEVASAGWQLFSDIDAQGSDTYFIKTRPDSFYQTGLNDFLNMNQLTHIEICGAQVEFCVDTTIRVAFHLGFTVSILLDGITTCDSALLSAEQIKAHHASIWKDRFGTIVAPTTSL